MPAITGLMVTFTGHVDAIPAEDPAALLGVAYGASPSVLAGDSDLELPGDASPIALSTPPRRPCLWCGADLDALGLRPQAVWCQPSHGATARAWRARTRAFNVRVERTHRRPRRRLWARARPGRAFLPVAPRATGDRP